MTVDRLTPGTTEEMHSSSATQAGTAGFEDVLNNIMLQGVAAIGTGWLQTLKLQLHTVNCQAHMCGLEQSASTAKAQLEAVSMQTPTASAGEALRLYVNESEAKPAFDAERNGQHAPTVPSLTDEVDVEATAKKSRKPKARASS